MPYKDKDKVYYPLIGVTPRKDEPALYESMQEAAKEEGISVQKYLLKAAREKLIRDGYMLESDK